MLEITGIDIENFGRHKKIKQDINGHLVGLFGANGDGKSTVLQALQLAFANTIDHPDSAKAFIRRCSIDEPTYAQVIVYFTSDGRKCSIMRRITKTTSSRKLVIEGMDKPLTSDKAVTDMMFELVGVDKKAINSTVFIRQGEMTNMFGKDTERRDFYTKLLMLGHLDKVATIVDGSRKQVSDSIQDLGAVIDQARSVCKESSDYYSECDKELQDVVDPSSALSHLRALQGLYSKSADAEDAVLKTRAIIAGLPDLESQTVLVQEKTQAIAEIKEAKTNLASYQSKCQLLEAKEATATSSVEASHEVWTLNQKKLDIPHVALAAEAPTPESFAEAINDLRDRITTRKQLASMSDERAVVRKDIADLTPGVEAAKVVVEEQQSELKEIESAGKIMAQDYKTYTTILEGIRSANTGCQCPVCGEDTTSTEFLQNNLDKVSEELDKHRVTYADKAAVANKNLKEYEANRLKLGAATSKDDILTASIKKMAASVLSQKSYGITIEDEQRALGEMQEKVEMLTKNSREHAAIDIKIQEATKRITDPGMDSAALEVLRKELAEAKLTYNSSLLQWEGKEAELQAMEAELTELQSVLAKHNDQALSLRLNEDSVLALDAGIVELLKNLPEMADAVLRKHGGTSAAVVSSLEELEADQAAYSEVRGKVTAAKNAMLADSSRLAELETRAEEQKSRIELAENISELSMAFKPSGVSLEYLSYKFEQIARIASDYLAEAHADFMVTASKDIPLAFDFLRIDKPGEVWLPQSRMSGGQKVWLAVATLRAIHTLVIPNVGLLILDEPTTHLDDDVQQQMADMLNRIGEEKSLQVIVCDHSQALVDAIKEQIVIPS